MKFYIKNIDFDGPLDLLITLIKANKCDIREIFVKDIIEQYLSIISKMKDKYTSVASEFILLASTLLDIKSKYYLYNLNLDEDDPAEDLYAILEEYEKYKKLANILSNKYYDSIATYSNKAFEIVVNEELDLSKYSINDMVHFLKMLEYSKKPIRDTQVISFKKISIVEKIDYISNIMLDNEKVYFTNIIDKNVKDDIVASFLGILELSRRDKINLHQENNFEDILIERYRNG